MTFLPSQIKKADEAFAQFDASGDDELDYKVPSLLFVFLQIKKKIVDKHKIYFFLHFLSTRSFAR